MHGKERARPEAVRHQSSSERIGEEPERQHANVDRTAEHTRRAQCFLVDNAVTQMNDCAPAQCDDIPQVLDIRVVHLSVRQAEGLDVHRTDVALDADTLGGLNAVHAVTKEPVGRFHDLDRGLGGGDKVRVGIGPEVPRHRHRVEVVPVEMRGEDDIDVVEGRPGVAEFLEHRLRRHAEGRRLLPVEAIDEDGAGVGSNQHALAANIGERERHSTTPCALACILLNSHIFNDGTPHFMPAPEWYHTPVTFPSLGASLTWTMARDFRDLAEEYAGRIFTYARYSLRHQEDAEDVTQEVLVRLWKHRDSIEPASTASWVMRVARNMVIDVARRRQSRTAVFAEGADVTEMAGHVASDEAADSAAHRAEIREHVEAALAELNEPYRSIVVMREVQGLAYDEIAAAMNMPLGTIKVYLHRARRQLRESMRAELE